MKLPAEVPLSGVVLIVSHTVDIGLTRKIAVRNSLQRRTREVAAFMAYDPVSPQVLRGEPRPPFQELMLV